MAAKERIDKRMVELGLADTRQKAQALLMAGSVRVNGQVVDKPGTQVALEATIQLTEELPYVSRGGMKLAGALEDLQVQVSGLTAVDVGASTGGFTDCLLKGGATRVYAVDVGYGQLAWSIASDPRVVVMDRTNIRNLEELPELVDLAVIDVSFISLKLVLPNVVRLVRDGGMVIAMVKPQFEVGKGEVGKGGVVRDDDLRHGAAIGVADSGATLGLKLLGSTDSKVHGPKGNREIFLLFQKKSEQQ